MFYFLLLFFPILATILGCGKKKQQQSTMTAPPASSNMEVIKPDPIGVAPSKPETKVEKSSNDKESMKKDKSKIASVKNGAPGETPEDGGGYENLPDMNESELAKIAEK